MNTKFLTLFRDTALKVYRDLQVELFKNVLSSRHRGADTRFAFAGARIGVEGRPERCYLLQVETSGAPCDNLC